MEQVSQQSIGIVANHLLKFLTVKNFFPDTTLNTKLQVTIDNIRLPHLSRHRTFSATIEVAPESSGDFGYGMIMGIEMMDHLGIDQSRTDKTITWGPDVTVPMVPMGYWSEGRIHALLAESTPPSTAVPVDDSSQVHEEIYTPLFATSGSDTPSFTEAKYEKLNLIEVVKRDGTELTSPQQSQLLQVLTSNEAAFQGRRGEYTGGAVGIILKPEAKPHRAKPYPIPLKNRDILEGEFRRQCSIGAMQ